VNFPVNSLERPFAAPVLRRLPTCFTLVLPVQGNQIIVKYRIPNFEVFTFGAEVPKSLKFVSFIRNEACELYGGALGTQNIQMVDFGPKVPSQLKNCDIILG